MNLVEHRILSQSEETVAAWHEALEKAEALWSRYTASPADRPTGAPSWWKGEDDAATVTTAGAATLRSARTRPR